MLAAVIGAVWLVGMTNAFNLLDNMDGLAGTLAAIAATFFAIDAVTVHKERLLLVLSLSLGLACLGFLPFNFRPGKRAAVFMGDSGSQVLGFTLGALGLATSWKVAETTVATLVLPILVLAVPILDTALVADDADGRGPSDPPRAARTTPRTGSCAGASPSTGRSCSWPRSPPGSARPRLAYSVLGDYRITLVGVLVTFALLVQFASFLVDLERGEAVEEAVPGGWMLRTVVLHRRRLLEVLVDFGLISARLLRRLRPAGRTGTGPRTSATSSPSRCPPSSSPATSRSSSLGLYQGIWRYAGSREAALDRGRRGRLGGGRVRRRRPRRRRSATSPRASFVVDALLCMLLIGASRFGERGAVPRPRDARRSGTGAGR